MVYVWHKSILGRAPPASSTLDTHQDPRSLGGERWREEWLSSHALIHGLHSPHLPLGGTEDCHQEQKGSLIHCQSRILGVGSLTNVLMLHCRGYIEWRWLSQGAERSQKSNMSFPLQRISGEAVFVPIHSFNKYLQRIDVCGGVRFSKHKSPYGAYIF